MNRFRYRWCFACALALWVATPLAAQPLPVGRVHLPEFRAASLDDAEQPIQEPVGPPPTLRHTGIKSMFRDLVGDGQRLPSMKNLFWAGLGGGLALAVYPADDNLNRSFINSRFANRFFKRAVLGELPTLLSTATIAYEVGRATDQPTVSHVGMVLANNKQARGRFHLARVPRR